MKSFHNIEKSAFKRGCYVGYSKSGHAFHIKRVIGGWEAGVIAWITGTTRARPAIKARTLDEISLKLEED